MTRTAQTTRPGAARSVRLLCVAAVVLLVGAGCTAGSGKGGNHGGGTGGSGGSTGTTSVGRQVVHGSDAALPKGVPAPPGKPADSSVSTSFGGTWTYTGATATTFGHYVNSLGKSGWKCSLTEKNAPSFGYTCTPPATAKKGTLQTYFLPAKKQIAVTFQNG